MAPQPKKNGEITLRGAPKTIAAKRKFLSAYANCGGVILAAAKLSGIDRGTHYDWLESDPNYRAAFDEAKEEAIELLEAEAIRRGVLGWKEPIYQGGVKVGDVTRYSHALLIFMLKARRPEVYRERFELTGKDGSALQQGLTLNIEFDERPARKLVENNASPNGDPNDSTTRR